MTDGLDIEAVGANDKRRVVVGVVLRPRPWSAVVFVACRKIRAIESLDLLATLGDERHVQMRRLDLGISADT